MPQASTNAGTSGPYYGAVKRAIQDALAQLGEGTLAEMSALTGIPSHVLGSNIKGIRNRHPRESIRIVGYTARPGRPRAIYAWGNGRDEPRPAPVDTAAPRGELDRMQDNIRRARRLGRPVPVNPWAQLAPSALKSRMARVMLDDYE
jgi:hypothetical protein